jgi:hypothetical protein
MNTEQMAELLDALNINELALLAKLAQERKEVKERELAEAAKIKFIKAYQDFRKLAPNATGWLCWEYENNCCCELEEQDFDLYEMLDCAIEHGVL